MTRPDLALSNGPMAAVRIMGKEAFPAVKLAFRPLFLTRLGDRFIGDVLHGAETELQTHSADSPTTEVNRGRTSKPIAACTSPIRAA